MKKKSVIITAVVIVAAAAIIVPRFLKPKEQVAAASIPLVSIQKPEIGNIELFTGLTGTVEPSDIVYIIPKVAGEVTDVYVKAGDYVEEGQKLLHIDTKQVDGAKIQLDTASVSLQDANTNLQRMSVLLQSGDISQQQYEQVQSSAKLAKLQYDAAKLAYDNQIEFSTITAPIGGLVESFNVEVHDNVAQSNVLCVISGEGTKAVSFNVTERVVNGLSMGDPIRVEKNGSEYHGVITEISSMVDAATGLFKVKASLEGADALATGAQVKLYVTSSSAENVMMVPTDAIYYQGGNAMVYTYKDNAVHEVPVEVGIYDADKTEITDGLTTEDDVIITWSSELFEGSQVEILGETAGADTAGEADGASEDTTEADAK
ncbi:efflux RND transporter periplasmic adaptor subunit [Clostridium transplantifaecale]|uniref:efflux RND transporter periplasmic adaptor subunit n=1 Tax=Clostridium transplantifaecale TaxID=2479838 RepID=UPI000F62EC32|nr:efflux RND transporter periplasmic adaptor subunit [Clostridium transplantifaecale]